MTPFEKLIVQGEPSPERVHSNASHVVTTSAMTEGSQTLVVATPQTACAVSLSVHGAGVGAHTLRNLAMGTIDGQHSDGTDAPQPHRATAAGPGNRNRYSRLFRILNRCELYRDP